MNPEIIHFLTNDFEKYKHISKDNVEFWYARDLQKLLEYKEWRNFEKVISKAVKSCTNAGVASKNHFVEINKMLKIGSGAKRSSTDYILTRYACYLIAQNGDPEKSQIAFAQAYFAIQTRKFELIAERINGMERVVAREKLAKSEKQLSGVIYERTKDKSAFGFIRNEGDKALFGFSTSEMKTKWKVPKSKPLADYSPTVVLKGKDFANEMTVFNTKEKNLVKTSEIKNEHVENNTIVRNAMTQRGIVPEKLKPQTDVLKLKRKLIEKNSSKGVKHLRSK